MNLDRSLAEARWSLARRGSPKLAEGERRRLDPRPGSWI